MHRLIGVPSRHAKLFWPQVVHWIEEACEGEGGSYLASDILEAIEAQDMQLWVAVDSVTERIDAVAVTEIRQLPRRKVCWLHIGAGQNMRAWVHMRHEMAEWARAQGCTGRKAFKSLARKGWARFFKEFECSHVLLERDL